MVSYDCDACGHAALLCAKSTEESGCSYYQRPARTAHVVAVSTHESWCKFWLHLPEGPKDGTLYFVFRRLLALSVSRAKGSEETDKME